MFMYIYKYVHTVAETNQTVKADSSSRWKHWPCMLRPTAPAAGSIGLTCWDQRLQQLEPLVSVSETNGSRSWNHRSHLLRPTAPAVGSIGLSFWDQQLQLLGLVSVAETNSFSCWEHRPHVLRPTAPAEAKDFRQLLEPRPTAPAAGTKTNSSSCWTIGLGSCRQWSQLLGPMVPPAQTEVLIC
jgi:hypothetical protein